MSAQRDALWRDGAELDASDVDGRVEWLTVGECLFRLQTVSLGRVGVSVGALPAILPVNFGVVDEGIVFRTAPGSKLDAAVAGNVVAFEADDADMAAGEAWSVLVVGQAEVVSDPDLLRRVLAIGVHPWAPKGKDHVVLVRAEQVTGRLIVREGRRPRPRTLPRVHPITAPGPSNL